jgi:phenylpropionate dioxygenase-like ring-hydroxylating dioxygenase large terminal subunit
MGAWDRRYERWIERALAARKLKGVPEAGRGPVDAGGAASAVEDMRSAVPPLGLREYWYPALPARKVGRKPVFWVMLGDELVFFRNQAGKVVALTDVCPHRGASLSEGDCYYRGFLSCPYHGATFDGRGECAAFLTEGPDSTMVGKLRARTYPTRTLRGWVFVWMGEGAPAPIEEDLPPELFERGTEVLSTYTYWHTNWMLAIENHSDAHNCFYVHRNSLLQLLTGGGGRARTPLGPTSKIVNDRALLALDHGPSYYAQNGEVPYQMHYPGVDGVWPLRRWRRLWGGFFRKYVFRPRPFETIEEWLPGHHLPCTVRSRVGGLSMYTRYAVPVKANLSRIIYFHSARPASRRERLLERLRFHGYYNWIAHYNFSGQDNTAASPCRYWTPEYLSPTDSQVVQWRWLVAEGSRDAERRRARVEGEEAGARDQVIEA